MATNKKKTNNALNIFLTTFIITLIAVSFLAKKFTPEVDVEIGGNSSDVATAEEEDNGIKRFVDDRLKWIQLEDNMPGVSNKFGEAQTSSNDEITYQDVNSKTNESTKSYPKPHASEQADEEEILLENDESTVKKTPPVPTKSNDLKNLTSQPNSYKMTKVYIGNYSTIEQAIAAQNKLMMDTNISVTPFVKERNGYYVLQAGSYANKAKAEYTASQLSSAGFAARIVEE